jgi:hypothetical protein
MVFAGEFPFSSDCGIVREERKHRKVLFLFKAQQIEKSESGPSFWQVQIWNDRSQKNKKELRQAPTSEIILNIFVCSFFPPTAHRPSPSHQSSSADQPHHHPKMARAQGAKNYRRPLLMELINEFLPNGYSLWNAVAAEYQRRFGESEERDPHEMKKYW